MKRFHNVVRVLIGLLFVVISGSKFGILPSFINMPEMFTPEGWAFVMAVKETGYMFPVIAVVSLFTGIAFLLNRYVAFAAVLMAPIAFNFAIFHVFMGFREFSVREAISYVPITLIAYIMYMERVKYAALFKDK